MARTQAPVRIRLQASAAWDHMARLNLSQNDLARIVGISPSYLSQLVNGTRCPSPKLRRLLLETLDGATFNELFVVERRDVDRDIRL
jgi:transcriptional regulator with XRE-family HTH domain